MEEKKRRERLTPEEAAAYWNERHEKSDQWRSGGDRGISEDANQAFYYLRYGLLLRMLVRHFGHERRLRILDAGCGRGWLTAQLHALGHHLVGVDQSEAAIRYARTRCEAGFVVSSLDRFGTDERFHAVVSMDVLYHITDDEQWRRSLLALSQVLDDEGILIFSDVLAEETRVLGDYIVQRNRAEYDRTLARHNLTITSCEPYGVFSSAAWHLCVRRRAETCDHNGEHA
jgi:2-polyprenyl-3-methyl-5-hydroxy-6-metoxy-1,4-benzoquinol methylase